MTEFVRFPIEGMTCGSCVARITGRVRKINGVESVRVDLRTDTATVGFDPARTSLEAIGEAVTSAGYEPRLEAAKPFTPQPRRGLLARFGFGR